ncbi:conserved hypothetical protein [Pyrenophora tritici-repentis Pt-1C-BFP]|uniref:Uncharacterized protein n=1 Tax=Pyrenophora tritici-repentis (strain Pt-1C-BFP) TaxID=426418 RepID=B2WNB4_PYRTR|nr:uncharacterized protein PTRG_11371 [Pyrenophora tritici-repentis Pt-1C-BFP]EDU44421.1 conserved hypothetical protein [Pyrenophora tritici-repentis Pt-1C-BFP]
MWEDNLEAPDDEVGITTATTYIARAIADYTDRPTADEELFWEFRQDFEGWTEAMFLRAQPIYTKELKRILRFKGVYTGRINMAPTYQRVQSQQPPLTYNNFDRFREYTPAYPQRPKGLSVPPIVPSGETDPYKAVPPIEFGNEKLDPKTINVFVKMWDRDKKYTGKPYDLLDDKLKIFYSICYHADIEPGQFHAVFPRILDGRAEEYYLHFVDQRMDTFLTAYTKLKNHFDTDVNHGHYYADWTTTSFVKVRRENPEKNLHEVLDIMLDKLQLCQRALGQQYMGEYALRTTVITACRGVKELEMALYKPSLECEVLFGDLRSSIENSLAMTVSVNFTEADTDSQYYLDRRYNNNSSGRLRGNYNPRGGRSGFTRGRDSVIHMLAAAIEVEIKDITFDYFAMHDICWELLGRMRNECRPYIAERSATQWENQKDNLPFIVGFVFSTAAGRKDIETKGLPNEELLKTVTGVMNAFLEEGKGTVITGQPRKI